MNIAHLLNRDAGGPRDRVALLFEGKRLTYAEVDDRSGRLAATFARRGIERGDRVALFLPNCPAFVLTYYALQRLGAVAVSVNAMSTSRELGLILRDSGARAIVVDASLAERVPADWAGWLVVTGGERGDHASLDELIASSPAPLAPRELAGDAPAAILYTSGTTGVPKGATLSHANVLTNARAAAQCYGAREGDRFLLYLPLFHCFGQNAVMNAAFAAGAAIVLQGRFNCDAVLASVRRREVTHFFGVPSAYVRLLEAGATASDFETVRYVFSAAAPLTVELARRWALAIGHAIQEGYGLTETSPFSTYNHRSEHRLGSVGTPIDGVRVRVVDPTGREIDRGEVGEIEVSGPNIMLGYWNQPLATAEAMRTGWFRTGDLGRMDGDGYLYVVDRLKEMIIVSGYKVYPSEVENVLHEHPAVAEPAVFGVPHHITGEAVHAHIVLRESASSSDSDLRRFCSEQLATYKVPAQFTFTDSLPKNATGKVLRRVLREETIRRSA